MPNFCCNINGQFGIGHDTWCGRNVNKGKRFMTYADGIGDVRFHYRDGSTYVLRAVQYETIGGDPNGCISDTTGEFENGNTFHVPNVVWWECIFE